MYTAQWTVKSECEMKEYARMQNQKINSDMEEKTAAGKKTSDKTVTLMKWRRESQMSIEKQARAAERTSGSSPIVRLCTSMAVD